MYTVQEVFHATGLLGASLTTTVRGRKDGQGLLVFTFQMSKLKPRKAPASDSGEFQAPSCRLPEAAFLGARGIPRQVRRDLTVTLSSASS